MKIIPKVTNEILTALEQGFYIANDGIKIEFEEDLESAIINTDFIAADFVFEKSDEYLLEKTENYSSNKPKIEITDDNTVTAGKKLKMATCEEVAILNFASATNPGGGFTRGSKAQEEDICRVSGLYACLNQDNDDLLPYYKINKACGSSLYTDGIIYSSQVPFLKDENYQWLDQIFKLSVVTCPAPNLNGVGFIATSITIDDIITRRITRILDTMIMYGHKNIVLGAWGCGVFGNSPNMIASIFKYVLEEKQFYFDNIVFAIPDKKSKNHQVFANVFAA